MYKIALAFILFSFHSIAQHDAHANIAYNTLNLRSPVNIPLILAGNFGEMRSNHFHTGLDIKTQGVEGHEILAIEDGYVSRVRISEWGYGKALYIDHPNGLTSVYAHLSAFPDKIDDLIYMHQQKNEAFQVDEIVLSDSVFVKKGELIAYSGNSGGSSAPHLHFEIRETKSEHALNPLLFKCYRDLIADNRPPDIRGIKLYAVSNQGYLIPGKSTYYTCTKKGDNWVINNDKPINIDNLYTENSYLGFGFHTTDKLDAAYNTCGIHHTVLNRNDTTVQEQVINYINFDNNRYLNSHQDYYSFKQEKKNIHKHFKTDLNPLNIYKINEGKISWNNAASHYNFIAYDVHGNKENVKFELNAPTAKPAKNPLSNTNAYYFPDSVNTFLKEDFQVLMEPGTFYEPLQKTYRKDTISKYLSPIYEFSESTIPVQKRYDLRIKVPTELTDVNRFKLGIGVLDDRNRLSFLGGFYIDDWVETASKQFGKFILVIDSIAPIIQPLDFSKGKDISKFSTLELTIEDNLSGIKTFAAYLNGSWVLTNWDRRKKRYIIPLDKRSKKILVEGKNFINIIAIDMKGNKQELRTELLYHKP
ncbi:M23 family metallopeptidase [Crocinitomix catalasitica]|uniref:M23 family metallopeptidase n=1 Tax=Crocinitomix catalasitica TaxID=184607 RepID=UPI0004895EA8|nr:M23 family metallopeptidase [Crocinitomix catalasitica]